MMIIPIICCLVYVYVLSPPLVVLRIMLYSSKYLAAFPKIKVNKEFFSVFQLSMLKNLVILKSLSVYGWRDGWMNV